MIQDLPQKPRLIVQVVLVFTLFLLIGLAVYGATYCDNIPEEIICPAPEYNNYL